MVNAFDQFDAPTQASTSSGSPPNAFDQFDEVPAPKQGSGLISNIGAGLNRSIAQTAGLAGDVGSLLAGPQMPSEIEGPIARVSRAAGNWIYQKAGPEAVERLMGLVGANPQNVQAVTPGEKLARNVGESVGSMAVPAIGAEAALGSAAADTLSPVARGILEGLRGSGTQPGTAAATAANVGRNALIGVGAGAGQTAAQAVAPNSPTAAVVGSMLGGLGVGAGEAAFRWAATRPSLETRAADRLLGSATDPAAVRSQLASGEPLSPLAGSQPTTPEATGDLGLLQVQNWARNQSPELFAQRAAENNAARVKAMADITPPESAAVTPGQMLTDRLDRLEAAHQAVVDAAQARAQETLGAVGQGQAPEAVGAQARSAIEARYAPAQAAVEQADTAARQQLAAAAQRVGGNQTAGDADTVRQQYGDQLRQFVQEGRDARAAEEGRLWNAARQNGDLVFDHTPTVQAVDTARGMINPAGGDRLTPAELSLYDTIGQWQQPQDFDTIKAMRSNIGDAADMAFRGGDRRAGSRLLTVRNGLDQSIENAVDSRVAQERAAVQAGTLDPSRTFEAALLRDRDQWQAARATGQRPGGGVAGAGPGVAPAQPVGEGAVPGGAGAAGATPEGRSAVAGDRGVESAAGSTVDRYAAARAFTRQTHQIFDQTPAGSVIARGPYGAPEKLPSSLVPGKFANANTQQVENARNFEAAVGGHPQAIAALQDYLAYDLKNTAWNPDTGRLNPTKFQGWMKAHDGLMTIYPELKAQFGAFAQAQDRLTQVQQLRDTLTQRLNDALGESNATVMGRYFKRGPAGADGIDRYLAETGGTPQARQAMVDHVTNDFLDRATVDGQLAPGKYAAWKFANGPALSRMPELAAKFSDAAAAQEQLTTALANKIGAVRDFENGAARFWLRSDPTTAVTNALSKRAGNDAVQNMRDLMTMTNGDAAAQAGVKRAVLGWLTDKGVSGKAAGLTGTDYIKTQTMQDLVNDNRAALREVFSPQEMKTLDAVAADLKMSDRSITGSKAPIGPGTARDLLAANRYGGKTPTLLRVIGNWVTSHSAAFLAGTALTGSWEAGLAAAGAMNGARQVASAARAARETRIQDLIIGAIRDPQQARTLLAKATPANVERLSQQLARRISQSAVAGVAAYQGASP